jgi:hypothetical protein
VSVIGINFDQQSAKRIAKVVRDYERKIGAGTPRPSAVIPPPQRFWVQLQTESSENPGQYNWKKSDFVAAVFQDSSPLVQDNTHYSAHEVNETSGLSTEYVELTFSGYDTSTNPVYLFTKVATMVTVAITSNTGVATYQGTIQTGAATDLTGTGISNTGATALILNLAEKGSTASEPYLPNGSWVIGIHKGKDTATGYAIIWCSEILGYVCEYDTSSGSTGSGGM